MFGQQTPVRGNQQVCSFYLKGQCKYGTQCWNLHPQNQGVAAGGMTSTFGVGGNVFGAKASAQQDTKELTEFMKQVCGEMTQWERSGQWLFSSFTPLKSHPLLAGFSDLSPEELRTKAYEALKTNTSSAYQEHWNKLQEQYKQLRDALRVPTQDAYQAMKEVYHTKSGPEQQGSSQAGKVTGFGKQPVFGSSAATQQPSPGTGLLGAKPQSSVFGGGGSLFGGTQRATPNLFGDSAKKSLFGGATTITPQSPTTFGGSTTITPQNPTTFGTQPNPSPFGGGSGNNLFKSGTSSSLGGGGGGGVFGGPPKIQGNNLFGGGAVTSPTAPTSASIFGAGSAVSTSAASGSIFGNPPSTNAPAAGNIFGGGGTTTNPSNPAAGGIFGGGSTNTPTQATGNLFGGSSGTVTTASVAGSVFGGAGQSQTSSIFGGGGQATTPTFGGGQTTTATFGGGQTTTPTFGSGQTTTPTFGGGQTTTPTFGGMGTGTTSIFSNPSGGSVFGSKPNQPQQQQGTTTPLFGSVASGTPSIFGGQPQAAAETQTQNPPSLFGGSTATGTTFGGGGTLNPSGGTGLLGNAPASGTQPGSIFGNPGENTVAAGLFGNQTQAQPIAQSSQAAQILPAGGGKSSVTVKAEWFTPIDQLVNADKEEFEADTFTSIPLCPPPLELCF